VVSIVQNSEEELVLLYEKTCLNISFVLGQNCWNPQLTTKF